MSSKGKELRKRFIKIRADVTKSFEAPKSLLHEFQSLTPKGSNADPLKFLDSYTTQLDSTNITECIFNDVDNSKCNDANDNKDVSFQLNCSDIVKIKENLIKIKPNEIRNKKASENSFNLNSSLLQPTPTKPANTSYKKENKLHQQLKRTKHSCTGVNKNTNQFKTNTKIIQKANELKHKLTPSSSLVNKVNTIINSIKLPTQCIIDEDVQQIRNETNIYYKTKFSVPQLSLMELKLHMSSNM